MTLQTTETKLNKKKRRKKYIQWIYLTLLLEEPITAEDIAWDENDVCRYERMCAHVHTRSHVHAVNFFQTQVLFLFPSFSLTHTQACTTDIDTLSGIQLEILVINKRAVTKKKHAFTHYTVSIPQCKQNICTQLLQCPNLTLAFYPISTRTFKVG